MLRKGMHVLAVVSAQGVSLALLVDEATQGTRLLPSFPYTKNVAITGDIGAACICRPRLWLIRRSWRSVRWRMVVMRMRLPVR
jgi:hypothetical protein